MTVILNLVDFRPVPVGGGVWRIERADTGKVLGLVEGKGRTWRAKASQLAFLGDGSGSGEPLGDLVPRALYAPLLASEGHHFLPDTHRSKQAAVVALQTYLYEHQAPAMGFGRHPLVRNRKAS